MSATQLFLVLGVAYLAPHLPKYASIAAGILCILLAVVSVA